MLETDGLADGRGVVPSGRIDRAVEHHRRTARVPVGVQRADVRAVGEPEVVDVATPIAARIVSMSRTVDGVPRYGSSRLLVRSQSAASRFATVAFAAAAFASVSLRSTS